MSDLVHSNPVQEQAGQESLSHEGNSMTPPTFQLSADGATSPNDGNPNTIQAKTQNPSPFQMKEEGNGEENTGVMGIGGRLRSMVGGGDNPTPQEEDSATGILIDMAKQKGVDLAWDYWEQLKEQYSLTEHLAKLLERAMVYLIDYGVRVTGIGAFLSAMNPYLEILKLVKTVIETIPQPIRVFMGFAIGYGMKYFSDKYMYSAIKEKHLNFLLIEGGDIMASIGNLIDFIYDLSHNPVSTIYKSVWAVVRSYTGNDEIDSFTALFDHMEDKAKDSTGYSGPRSGQGEGEAPQSQDDRSAVEKAHQENLFNADLGFFWMRMGQPKLDRWNEENSEGEQEERGGLAIDGGLGLKLFGQAMGTDDIDLKIPYSGDWQMAFSDLTLLSEPISLGNWFRGGPVVMPMLRIKSGVGLDYMDLRLYDFAFGNDVFVANELGVTYSAGAQMLGFTGDTQMNFFGHQFMGRFNLNVGTDGDFKGGTVDVMMPEELDIIENRLSLSNLNFVGRWGDEGVELLEVAGDIHANLQDKLDFDSERTAIRWENGQFMGLVNRMSLLVPLGSNSFVELILDQGKISKEGFEAGKITLKFSYGDQETQEENEQRLAENRDTPTVGQQELQSIIPGFDLNWIKHTGLETLVVSASASGVSLNSDGLNIDGDLEKKLHKFAAEFLGVTATFDGDKNEGSLKGKWDYQVPNLPNLSFDFPIIPGINAGVGLGAELGVGAELDGHLRKLSHAREGNKQPWELGGYAGLMGNANVRAHFDVSAGHPLLVSIHAGLFAEAGAELAADAALMGNIVWDDNTNKLGLSDDPRHKPSASFDMHADLHATLGAEVRARAFHFFNITLWEYKFLDWHMGLWRAKGRLQAKEDGGYEFSFEQVGFDAGIPERKPTIEYKVADTEEVILERERKSDEIGDSLLFWRLVHDTMDPTGTMSPATQRVMLEKLTRLNDTGKDMSYYTGSADTSMSGRTDRDSDAFSMIMLPEEWERYSTVDGFLGIGTKRRGKNIKKIDRRLREYHEANTDEEKKYILIDLIDNVIPNYMHDKRARNSMVGKLYNDCQRELKRLETALAFADEE